MQAKALQANLTKLGIPRVTLDIGNYSRARTFIILLSSGTKSNPALVQATFRTAGSSLHFFSPFFQPLFTFIVVNNKPIFNIGLSDFFEIFDENKWSDKEALRNLRDALARLNQVFPPLLFYIPLPSLPHATQPSSSLSRSLPYPLTLPFLSSN